MTMDPLVPAHERTPAARALRLVPGVVESLAAPPVTQARSVADPRRGRPRLLHVLGSSKFGGDSVLVLELARTARASGYEVDILATDPRFQDHIQEEGFGLKFREIEQAVVATFDHFFASSCLLRLTSIWVSPSMPLVRASWLKVSR